jgi:hypothetical protein
MELLWNNASLFNDMSATFGKLTFDQIKNYPAKVRVTYHTRNEDGDFPIEGVEKVLTLSKLIELETFQKECDDAYLIHDITLYKTLDDTDNGLILDERHRLGAQLLNKYTLYSYSWFNDSDNSD